MPARRHFFDLFRSIDVGFKVVGTGSVGLRDYVVLFEGNGPRDPMFLQIKQEVASAYAKYLPGDTAESVADENQGGARRRDRWQFSQCRICCWAGRESALTIIWPGNSTIIRGRHRSADAAWKRPEATWLWSPASCWRGGMRGRAMRARFEDTAGRVRRWRGRSWVSRWSTPIRNPNWTIRRYTAAVKKGEIRGRESFGPVAAAGKSPYEQKPAKEQSARVASTTSTKFAYMKWPSAISSAMHGKRFLRHWNRASIHPAPGGNDIPRHHVGKRQRPR